MSFSPVAILRASDEGWIEHLVPIRYGRKSVLLTNGLLWPPFWVVALAVGLLAARSLGWNAGVAAALGVAACQGLGLWTETMEKLALVSFAVSMAVLIAFPLGVLAARRPRLEAALRSVLDLMQTAPPWVYLIPAVMIFSLGKVPVLMGTVIYGVPPMPRLTTRAFRQAPRELVEMGAATGATPAQTLTMIEIPAARGTLLLGLNQCILISLAMVVLAGLVGAGGLGAEVTRGLTRMEMGLGLRSGLTIVAVAIFLDRVTRRALVRG